MRKGRGGAAEYGNGIISLNRTDGRFLLYGSVMRLRYRRLFLFRFRILIPAGDPLTFGFAEFSCRHRIFKEGKIIR